MEVEKLEKAKELFSLIEKTKGSLKQLESVNLENKKLLFIY